MGDKYIIELEEKPFHKENGDFLYRVKGFTSLVFDLRGLKRLKPYSRPDTEAIRMEAYDEGYKTAKVQCNIQAEKDLREVGERHYQKGLSDVWECAKKIEILSGHEFDEIFTGYDDYAKVFENYTPQEATEKIRQYEEKARQARIEYNREEIKDVLSTTMKECNVSLDDIAEVLEKMQMKDGDNE